MSVLNPYENLRTQIDEAASYVYVSDGKLDDSRHPSAWWR